MEDSQNGRCAICGERPDPSTSHRGQGVLHVDHDHETGKIRELLCHSCNLGFGHYEARRLAFEVYYRKHSPSETFEDGGGI
jgi:hypothetical protein